MSKEDLEKLVNEYHIAILQDRPINASYIMYELLIELIAKVYKDDNSSVG